MRPPSPTRDWVAPILAVGIATALNIIVIGILWDAISHPDEAGISSNATQVLMAWGGGMLGILGAVFGYRAGAENGGRGSTDAATPTATDTTEGEELP